MGSSTGEEIAAAFDALDAAVSRLLALSLDAASTRDRFAALARCEAVRRRLPAFEHEQINAIRRQATPDEVDGPLVHALADRLHITRGESSRRIHDAEDLGSRRSLTGEPLPALLTGTAAAQRAGHINTDHVRAIRRFCHALPNWVDAGTRERAEADLARQATRFRPEQVAGLADKLSDAINPDGNFTDADRARARGLTLGAQDANGMSTLRGCLNPELRATLEAVLAKLAAPGMANPERPDPVVEGSPTRDAIDGDTRSAAQRNHDGLLAGLRGLLASGDLGQHNGLSASIIVTTTLTELEAAAGIARTGGGSRLPLSDVIRLAGHARHYLAIFDNAKPLALYHTKRLASPGQRIVLYAQDRGCSHPGCDVPGYLCEVHHITDYAETGDTGMDNLTFACGPHHRLLTPGGWRTRGRSRDGRARWLPPAHLDHGQPRVNVFHHPEKLLHECARVEDDDDGP